MRRQAIIAAVIYPMVNVVFFGFGAIAVLWLFSDQAKILLPIVIVASFIATVPISWFMAPQLSQSLSARQGTPRHS
ncbi:MAG: hypothetical protein ABI414_04225 [Devosia sp.]